jgi:hypothetical protein
MRFRSRNKWRFEKPEQSGILCTISRLGPINGDYFLMRFQLYTRSQFYSVWRAIEINSLRSLSPTPVLWGKRWVSNAIQAFAISTVARVR